MNDISPQVRSNACTSYLFLAPFFLVARGNPALAHSFVRSHAWRALGLQAVIMGTYFIFGWWGVASGIQVPYVGMSVGRILETTIFLVASLGLFLGVIAAARGQTSQTSRLVPGATSFGDVRLEQNGVLSESSKARIMASYVPFLGFFAAVSEPHLGARVGARFSAWYAVLAIALAVFWRADASLSAFTLAYILLVSFVAVQLFVFNRVWRWSWIEQLPDAQRVGLLMRTAGDWAGSALRVIFGHKGDFSWKKLLATRTDLEAARDVVYARYFDQPNFPGSPRLAYFPIINLVLPLVLRGTRSRWIPALGQGFVLTSVGIVLFFIAPTLLPFLAFPFALGMANVIKEPLYKVPFAYCISGMFRRLWSRAERVAKAAKDTHSRVETVSLSVERSGQ